MAEAAALPGLEAELTCAVCLDLFREPVTAPCGHNFCRGCLAQFWAGDRRVLLGFTCPQCRAHFPDRPELHPNRVLCAVVEGFERGRLKPEPPDPAPDQAPVPDVPCDSCPPGGASASRTCLTCLASFCPEHLEPHRQSAAFASHRLSLPLADLAQRRCPRHGKLLEFYCRPHAACICAVCLLEHRACATQTAEEARDQREEELKALRTNVGYQIIQTQHSLELAQYQKQHIKESSVRQQSSLSYDYNEMKTMIEEEEKIAAKLIEDEENKANLKVDDVLDQITSQLGQLKEYKDQLDTVLAHTEGMVFWKNVSELPVISLESHTPPQQIELDSRKVELIGKAVSALKQNLMRQLKFSLEQRVCLLEQKGSAPGRKEPPAASDSETPQTSNPPEGKQSKKSSAPGRKEPPAASDSETPQTSNPPEGKQSKKKKLKPKPPPNQSQSPTAEQREIPSNPFVRNASPPRNRQDFLQYNCKVSFNQRTAHKKLVLSERYTSLSVTDQPQSYPELPERFFNCPQVLGLQWFTNGRRYWEVTNNGSSFWAVGIACSGMDRSGSRSRLGRNGLSWCVESFGLKLSAWHGDREVIVSAPQPRVMGVYVDFETGSVSFYSVSDAMRLLFSFKAQFKCQVFPAFWVGSSGTKLTLGQSC
ncbi:E3 ubiquitin/ISG15 ligase TRIM25 isoform X2 [Heptranchias perlo]|uniref:E3 ubiquitin/ISG15 ligase TRIM25 isoform X2 n=1 Tax=Heptranchias perlo TaxID=212740 RepID=UPI003559FC74